MPVPRRNFCPLHNPLQIRAKGKQSHARELISFLKDHAELSFSVKNVEKSQIDSMDNEALAMALHKAFISLHPDKYASKPKLLQEMTKEVAKNISSIKVKLTEGLGR